MGVSAFISKYAQDNDAILIDALDGDLSKLPDLGPKEAPEPDEDEDSDGWEDDEDYDDDEDHD